MTDHKTFNSVRIVSCTRKSQSEFQNSMLGRSLDYLEDIAKNLNIEIFADVFYENVKGMSTCYNEALSKARMSGLDTDVMIFIHDDVMINDMFIFEKLFTDFQIYDVIGLAGARRFSLTTMPVCWHAAPKDSFTGFVCHPFGKDATKLQSNYFGPAPSIAAVIDGLFIAFNKKAIQSGIEFDPQFEFDFYDADISLTAQKKYNLKLGVSPILVTHQSHGNGLNSDRYRVTQDKFVTKWRSKPVDVK